MANTRKKILEDLLTYENPMPDRQFSDVPASGSNVDVDRMVNGQPAWEVMSLGEERKPKKFIITDWSAIYEPYGAIDTLSIRKRCWEFILSQGNECYVWVGKLIKVTDIDQLMKALQEVKLIDPEELKAILAKHGITKAEQEIVDFTRFKSIAPFLTNTTNTLATPIINLIEFAHLDIETALALFKTIPKDKKLILKLSMDREKEKTALLLLQQLVEKLDCIEKVILTNVKCPTEYYLNLRKYLPKDAEIETTDLLLPEGENYNQFPELNYNGLEKKEIEPEAPEEEQEADGFPYTSRYTDDAEKPKDAGLVADILKKAPNTRALSLFQYGKVAKPNDIPVMSKLLNVWFGEVTNDVVAAFVAKCPNVESLSIPQHPQLNDASTEAIVSLQKLDSLTLALNRAHLNFLEPFIEGCPSLTKINFKVAEEPTTFVCNSKMTKLKELELNNVNIVWDTPINAPCQLTSLSLTRGATMRRWFSSLLNHCPELENLVLWSLDLSHNQNEKLNIAIRLEKLKSLTIRSVKSARKDDIQHLLEQCPNIEKLTIEEREGDVKLLENCTFPPLTSLEELSLSTTDSSESKASLLRQCPNLKKLDITITDKLPVDAIKPFQLNKLEELKLNFDSYFKTITPFLTAANKVKKLTLVSKSKYDYNEHALMPVMENLTTLDISGAKYIFDYDRLKLMQTTTSTKAIDQIIPILSRCPNLTELILDADHLTVARFEELIKRIETNYPLIKKIQLKGSNAATLLFHMNTNPQRIKIQTTRLNFTRHTVEVLDSPKSINNPQDIVDMILRCDDLECLDVSGLPITYGFIEKLKDKGPQYLKQFVFNPGKATADSLNALIKKWPNIELETSYQQYGDKDDEIKVRCSLSPKLNEVVIQKLNITAIPPATDLEFMFDAKKLIRIMKNSPNLKSITLTFLRDDIPKTTFTCPLVTNLKIHLPEVTIQQAQTLVEQHLPNLTKLEVDSKVTFTADAITPLLLACKNLKEFTAYSLAPEDYEKLKKRFPHVMILIMGTRVNRPNQQRIDHPNREELNNQLQGGNFQSHEGTGWHAENQPHTLDKRTTSGPVKARQLFAYKKGNFPPPNNYRLQVDTDINLGSQVELTKQFKVQPIPAPSPKAKPVSQIYYEKYHDRNDYYLGKTTVVANEWTPLPSLSSKEDMVELSASTPVELGYSKEQALYYVRAKNGSRNPVTVDFIIKSKLQDNYKIPSATPNINFSVLKFAHDGTLIQTDAVRAIKRQFAAISKQEKMATLMAFCSSFTPKDTNIDSLNGIDILNSLIENKAGVCRHRTQVFMALCKAFKPELTRDGINARAIHNDCHAYMEMECDGAWNRMDLGGGESQLTLEPMQNQSSAPQRDSNQPAPQDIRPPPAPEPIDSLQPPREWIDDQNTLEESVAAPVLAPSQPAAQQAAATPLEKIMADNPFCTWNTVSSQANNINDYCKEVMTAALKLAPNKRNVLVSIPAEATESFHHAMTNHLQQTNDSSLYLNTLSDANEKQAKVADGALAVEPSRLVDFIQQAKEGDALITNWSDYKAMHVGFNTLFDAERKFKSHLIAPPLTSIVVMDKAKLKDMGEDFFSRFRAISEMPSFPLTDDLYKKLELKDQDNTADYKTAEFYDTNWQNVLLGKININGFEFISEAGDLVQALRDKKPGILLQNAPWHKLEFRLFINELLIKRHFYYNGEIIPIPADFQIKAVTVPFRLQSKRLRMSERASDKAYVLNTQTLKHFVRGMSCQDKKLYHQDGWIKQYAGKEIQINVTESIPAAYWAQLISLAEKHDVTLTLSVANGVTLPDEMLRDIPNRPATTTPSDKNELYVTNDIELAEEILHAKHPSSTVVSINDTTEFNDLIERPVKLPSDGNRLQFQSVLGNIWEKLKRGDTIILKGSLSPTLARQLESLFAKPPCLWVNGKMEYPDGKLIIITDKENPLRSVAEKNMQFTQDEIQHQLNKNNESNPLYPTFTQSLNKFKTTHPAQRFSYGQLRDMTKKLRTRTDTNPFKSYFRLNPSDPVLISAKDAWEKKPKAIKAAPLAARHSKILAELASNPYLFVAGPSGVGKSTYILTQLKKENYKVHVGIDNIEKWLTGPADEHKVLFIDEANLEREGTWDILEGIFNKTPGILYNGQYYPITDKHKVIFAGNYNNFSGRQQHKFFIRHGQVINFKEMPDDVLASEVIKPALLSVFPQLSADTMQNLTTIMLETYKKINTIGDNHPFTPRNLKIICLRLMDYMQTHNELCENNMEKALHLAIMDEASGIIPPEKQKQFKEWTSLAETQAALNKTVPHSVGKCIIPPSRQSIFRLLQTQFTMRELVIANPAWQHFDIPSLLIEGMPGIGKSYIAIEYLKSMGYTQGSLEDKAENVDTSKRYYYLTPTDPDKMIATMLKAFHEGAVLVIDELNSLVLERVMNQLLSGYDLDGNRAKKKGFMIVGTQNPITFAGRQALSTAFENRFRKIMMADYPINELKKMATELCEMFGYPNAAYYAQATVGQYLSAKQYAIANHKRPAPTPRDLFEFIANKEKVLKQDITNVELVDFIETPRSITPEPEALALEIPSVSSSRSGPIIEPIEPQQSQPLVPPQLTPQSLMASQATIEQPPLRIQTSDDQPFTHTSTRLFYVDIQNEIKRIQKSTYGDPKLKTDKLAAIHDLLRFTTNEINKTQLPSDIIIRWLEANPNKLETLKQCRRDFFICRLFSSASERFIEKHRAITREEQADRRKQASGRR